MLIMYRHQTPLVATCLPESMEEQEEYSELKVTSFCSEAWLRDTATGRAILNWCVLWNSLTMWLRRLRMRSTMVEIGGFGYEKMPSIDP